MSFYKQGHISNFQGIMIFKQLENGFPLKTSPDLNLKINALSLKPPFLRELKVVNIIIELKFVIYSSESIINNRTI